MLIKNENNNYKLNIIGSKLIERLSNNEGACWLPEYANWMIEKIPSKPFNADNKFLLDIQNNSRIKKTIQNILSNNEYIIMLTLSLLLLGTKNFLINTEPTYNSYLRSKYIPDNVIKSTYRDLKP